MGSVAAAPGLWSTGSVVVALGLSCSVSSGIFLDQSLHLCLLHWQMDSSSMSHREAHCLFILLMVSFAVPKLLRLIRYHLFIFCFCFLCLRRQIQKILLWLMSKRVFCLYFLLGALWFLVLHPFWICFCIWYEKLFQFHSFAKNWLFRKDPDPGKDWKQEEKGTTEDEMVGCHHRLHGHEFEQAPGVGGGQGSLVCCSPWGRKESDMTEWQNWTGLHSFTCSCPVFPALLIEKTVFSLLHILVSFVID